MLTENKLDFGTLETRIIKCLFSFKHLNSGVAYLLEQATKQDQSCDEPTSLSSLTAVLRQIILNAQANTTRLPTGRRHPEVLKNFCTSLLI